MSLNPCSNASLAFAAIMQVPSSILQTGVGPHLCSVHVMAAMLCQVSCELHAAQDPAAGHDHKLYDIRRRLC